MVGSHLQARSKALSIHSGHVQGFQLSAKRLWSHLQLAEAAAGRSTSSRWSRRLRFAVVVMKNGLYIVTISCIAVATSTVLPRRPST